MLNYRDEEIKSRKENTKKLRQSLSNNIPKWLEDKIQSFCEKFDFDYDLIKYKILNDDLFLLNFIKDPIKQSFHQNLAINYIKNLKNVSNFQYLPSGGNNALYVISGIIVSGQSLKTSTANVKSIDFSWDYLNKQKQTIKCYASHKYTFQAGGSQDHQFSELISFLDHSKQHNGSDFFYAICDGRYYQLPYNGCLTKIDYLNKNHKGNRSYSLDINQLENHMANIL